jgi:hypothetical protein
VVEDRRVARIVDVAGDQAALVRAVRVAVEQADVLVVRDLQGGVELDALDEGVGGGREVERRAALPVSRS